jgi:hypothetical protein
MIKFDIDDPEQERLLASIDRVLRELRKKGATDEQIMAFAAMVIAEKETMFPKEMLMECITDLLEKDKLK